MTWTDMLEFTTSRRVRLVSQVSLVAFIIALGVATHWPKSHLVRLEAAPSIDKLQHFTAYAILTALLVWAANASSFSLWRRLAVLRLQTVLILVVVLLIGCVDECTQPLVGRTCSRYDLLADMVGALIILGALNIWSMGRLSLWSRWLPYEPLELR